ncbi:MAG: hypothetical protein P8X98_14560, partial [Woeseiaceae bacterium]
MQFLGHFLGRQLYAAGTEQRRRIDQSAVHLRDALGQRSGDVFAIHIDECRSEDGGGVDAARAADPEREWHRGRTDHAVAFHTRLCVKAIHPEECSIIPQGRPTASIFAGGIEFVPSKFAITVTVRPVE